MHGGVDVVGHVADRAVAERHPQAAGMGAAEAVAAGEHGDHVRLVEWPILARLIDVLRPAGGGVPGDAMVVPLEARPGRLVVAHHGRRVGHVHVAIEPRRQRLLAAEVGGREAVAHLPRPHLAAIVGHPRLIERGLRIIGAGPLRRLRRERLVAARHPHPHLIVELLGGAVERVARVGGVIRLRDGRQHEH